MLQEYLNRTVFVVLHSALVLFYLYVLVRSWARLASERRALRQLDKDMGAADDAGATGGRARLDRLRESLEGLRPTSLRRQLSAIVGTTSAGEDFDTQRVLAQISRSLSAWDDLIRFSINGLVIVGLMGTLYAFYQMWGTGGAESLAPAAAPAAGVGVAPNLSEANSNRYLESMSTALLVSLVGLGLALLTNFFFAVLRTRRQAFLDRVGGFLVPVAGLLPTDAKTHLLLTNLLAPLNLLVEQLTLQNDQVLRGLTDAVHARTEQLNKLISDVIGAFSTETLKAVENLQQTTGRLADSSLEVASTMQKVGQSLERTKDIGRLVDQLEASSGQLITSVSGKLRDATDEWIATYDRAAKNYEANLQRQAETMEKVSRDATAIIRDDLNEFVTHALAEMSKLTGEVAGRLAATDVQLAATLTSFGGKFTQSVETLSANWMTEFKAATDESENALRHVVNGWTNAVKDTTTGVNSAFANARELVTATTGNVNTLNAELLKLQTLVRTASETAGAPVYLKEAVERLDSVSEALTSLAAKLEYGQALRQLQEAAVAGRDEVRSLGRQVDQLRAVAQDDGVAAQLGGLDTRLGGLDSHLGGLDRRLAALHTDVEQLPSRIKTVRRPAVGVKPPPPPPPTRWQRVRGWFRWRRNSSEPTPRVFGWDDQEPPPPRGHDDEPAEPASQEEERTT